MTQHFDFLHVYGYWKDDNSQQYIIMQMATNLSTESFSSKHAQDANESLKLSYDLRCTILPLYSADTSHLPDAKYRLGFQQSYQSMIQEHAFNNMTAAIYSNKSHQHRVKFAPLIRTDTLHQCYAQNLHKSVHLKQQ